MANSLVQNQLLGAIAAVGGRVDPKMYTGTASAVASGGRVSLRSGGIIINARHGQELSSQSIRRSSASHRRLPNWDFDHLQSLKHEYAGEENRRRIEVLKGQVKIMLEQEENLLSQLELIDALKRLGVSHYFEENILSVLRSIYSCDIPKQQEHDHLLWAKALEFRLMRQHGFNISSDIFDTFKDENGGFKASLSEDLKGLVYLYDASNLQKNNEEANLELAREFTAKYLKKKLEENEFDEEEEEALAASVRHSLELPLHRRMRRLEARSFIDIYEKRRDMNPILLELAKLDFNIVQQSYQNELKYLSRWWKSSSLGGEALKFARDILVENFFWSLGIVPEREKDYCRMVGTKVLILITIIDDIYDIYGTLDELELFTSAIERWDINSIDELPDYMKPCFRELHSLINQLAYDALKLKGLDVIPYLAKAWADLCRAYMQEARWYYNGYTPTLEEYTNNAWISVSAPLILAHIYIFVSDDIRKEDLESFYPYHNIIRSSAIIMRLTNDLGKSPLAEQLKGGDVSKAMTCYMKEKQTSEEGAREHIEKLISDAWKEMNLAALEDDSQPLLSPELREIAVDIARAAHCMYQHGDGHAYQNSEMSKQIAALLFDPIPTV